jgi:hypothetical protein
MPRDGLGVGMRRAGRNHRCVDEKIGVFGYRPGLGYAGAETQVLVAVDESLEDEVFDFGAGRVGREDRVEDAGIADRGVDELLQAAGVAAGLFIVGGHPEVGLQQGQAEHHGDHYEKTAGAQKNSFAAIRGLPYN